MKPLWEEGTRGSMRGRGGQARAGGGQKRSSEDSRGGIGEEKRCLDDAGAVVVLPCPSGPYIKRINVPLSMFFLFVSDFIYRRRGFGLISKGSKGLQPTAEGKPKNTTDNHRQPLV